MGNISSDVARYIAHVCPYIVFLAVGVHLLVVALIVA